MTSVCDIVCDLIDLSPKADIAVSSICHCPPAEQLASVIGQLRPSPPPCHSGAEPSLDYSAPPLASLGSMGVVSCLSDTAVAWIGGYDDPGTETWEFVAFRPYAGWASISRQY